MLMSVMTIIRLVVMGAVVRVLLKVDGNVLEVIGILRILVLKYNMMDLIFIDTFVMMGILSMEMDAILLAMLKLGGRVLEVRPRVKTFAGNHILGLMLLV